MTAQKQVEIPAKFPEGHRLAGLPTNLTKITDMPAHGRSMSDWGFYKSDLNDLIKEAIQNAKSPEEKAAEKRTKTIALGVGAALLTTVGGLAAAYKLQQFHANPAIYPDATVRAAINAIAGLDDANTDLVPEKDPNADAALWIIDQVGGKEGGIPLWKLLFTQNGSDLKVEIHSVSDAQNTTVAETAPSLPSWLDNELVQALQGGDMQGMQTAVLSKATQFKESATALLSPEQLKAVGPGIVFYNQVWDALDEAFGDPQNADFITRMLDKTSLK